MGVLATSTDVGEKGSVISHIGWPLLKSTENIRSLRLRDVLERRSNDYWMCDLLSEALFGVDFVYGHCAYDGLRGGVSIIIPAFNVHNTLPAVLDSILTAAGILPPSFVWECIVIDDLSEPPIDIRGYEKYNVQLIRSNKRLSCGGARNLGVFKASQPLVMFCDGDIVLDKDYIKDHITRHFLMPNLITLSFRERLAALTAAVSRSPRVESDTRFHAFYDTTWIGFNKITAATEVSPYSTTRAFRDFGFGRTVGPTNLQFMAKGNNLVMPRWLARLIRFPDDFVGWGPEDVCFAAESIAHGAFVTPVMCTAVFHIDHPPRSGDLARQNSELKANLCRYDARLNTIWNFRRDADFLRDITPGAL
ncbi:MAG: glycosyltransferase family 2 protein [Verrucomicrobia bacterium]|nr:glycosyltransferase family 2 protein [Verrucomicrobiota bacterium]